MAISTYDPTLKLIKLDQIAPVDESVVLDVQTDLYSDAKLQWLNDLTLNRFSFPWLAIGGQPLPGGAVAPRIYFLAAGWKIVPYEAPHQLDISENLFSEDGEPLFELATGTDQIAITVTNTLASGDDRIGEILSILQDTSLDQRMRDALALNLTPGTPIAVGSNEQKVRRIDQNTQLL